jgi:hypothetical protein
LIDGLAGHFGGGIGNPQCHLPACAIMTGAQTKQGTKKGPSRGPSFGGGNSGRQCAVAQTFFFVK